MNINTLHRSKLGLPIAAFIVAIISYYHFSPAKIQTPQGSQNSQYETNSLILGGSTSVHGPWSTTIDIVTPAIKWVKHKITRGETLSTIWRAYGATHESVHLAAQALKDTTTDAIALKHGEEVEIGLSVAGEIKEFRKKLDEGKTIILSQDESGKYSTQLVIPEIVEQERTIKGTIESNFVTAALSEEVPYDVIDDFVDLFGSRVEFNRALQPGDTFVIKYNVRTTASQDILKAGAVTAASIKTGGNTLSAIRHANKDGKATYFDESGNALGNYFLRYPLQFTKISSTFSDSRLHPILKIRRPHNGVDFAAPTGTPVRAVADGVVEKAGWSGGGGIELRIRHSDRWSTSYLHLSKIIGGIRVGSRVTRGQVVAAVGMTGLATAPHLHFSLYDRGIFVNPLTTKLPQLPVSSPIPHDYLMAALQSLDAAYQIINAA